MILAPKTDIPNPDSRAGSTHNLMSKHASTDERFPRELETLRQLADGMPQIVWVAQADGSPEYYNKKWYGYTGLALENSTGEAWRALVHPDDRERAETTWAEAFREGTPYQIEFRLKGAADGEFRWFLCQALPHRDAAGKVINWFGTCTDIHEQKLTEDTLRATTDAMSRENAQKDEFLALVSHELRTPLNAVFGWTRLMQEHVLGEAERAQAIDSIMRNAEAQARLIEDVLDITRIVNQKLSLDREIVQLWRIVTEAIDAVLPAADAKGVSLISEVESHDLLVHADRMRLEQVVMNLLSNAVKFTPRGGEVRIAVMQQREFATIVVSDTGQGIDPELLPHIFERFRQGDSSSTRRHGGLGLGLAIAHQLVRLHGGEIQVESAGLNEGSRFTVRLPILAVGSLPSAHTDPSHFWSEDAFPAEHLRGLNVMVVDDEPSVRELLALTLAKCGASVTLAASVQEALAGLANLSPDVVVSDIAMPGMDGYEFIHKLRELVRPRDGREVPVIALTACASGQDRDLALQAGFDRHLTKPVDPAELVRVIAQTHSARRAAPAQPLAASDETLAEQEKLAQITGN
jgi:PAS domain S-box-containing protein